LVRRPSSLPHPIRGHVLKRKKQERLIAGLKMTKKLTAGRGGERKKKTRKGGKERDPNDQAATVLEDGVIALRATQAVLVRFSKTRQFFSWLRIRHEKRPDRGEGEGGRGMKDKVLLIMAQGRLRYIPC